MPDPDRSAAAAGAAADTAMAGAADAAAGAPAASPEGQGSPAPRGHNHPPAEGAPLPWYADGGRKTALGFWAGTAVLTYGAMQATGFLADVPFVALAVGGLVYFAVRGVAVVRREMERRETAHE